MIFHGPETIICGLTQCYDKRAPCDSLLPEVDIVMKMPLQEQSTFIKTHGRAALHLDYGTLLRNSPLEQT